MSNFLKAGQVLKKKVFGRAVLFQDTGELGNRLVSYSYLLAFSAEYQLPITNLCFWRYAHFFNCPSRFCERAWLYDTNKCRMSSSKRVWERLLKTLLKLPGFGWIRSHFEFDGDLVCTPFSLFSRLLAALAARSKRLLEKTAPHCGYSLRKESQWDHFCSLAVPYKLITAPFTDPALLVKHAELIRSRFRLAEPLCEKLDQYFLPLRKRYQRILGIHIRRGDYSRYRGGQYFFEFPTYRLLIAHLSALFPGEDVGFVIASNAPFPDDVFTGFSVHRAPGHLALDMYALSRCDLIAGPPSTFSGWASFIGETPIYFLHDKDLFPQRSDLNNVWSPRFY